MSNNTLRKILYLLLLTLPTLTPVAGQTLEMAKTQIDKLAEIDEESFASYADDNTYDEEYFGEKEPATIYYPKDLKERGKVPAVIIVHGFNCKQKFLQKLPKQLSSHGFICIIYTALDQKRPFQWPPGLMAAYEILRGESMRPDSPIYDHVDLSAVALVGHSMGGAGVLHTAMMPYPNGLRGKIKTVIGLNPYNGGPMMAEVGGGANDGLGDDLSHLQIPTMIVTGSYDLIAFPWKSLSFYNSLQGPAKHAFLSIEKMDHADWYFIPSEPNYPTVRAIVYLWLMAYLADDPAYRDYFIDSPGSAFDRYIKPVLGNTPNPLTRGGEPFPPYLLSKEGLDPTPKDDHPVD